MGGAGGPLPVQVLSTQAPVMFIPFLQVYGLLDALVTDLLVLAEELSPVKNVEEAVHFCT